MSQDNASDAGGFFSRWSQRKQAVKQGITLPEAQAADSNQADKPLPLQQASAGASDPLQTVQESAPVPTLEDVAKLTPESDFSSFMTQNVPSEVKNAAVKKLFADPHFNIMDGLDIYIGDYNTPDPMPAGMLQKMVGAQLLGLFDKPDEAAAKTAATAEPVLPAVSPAADLGGNPEQSPAAQQGSPAVAQSPASLPDLAGPASPVLQPHVKAHSEHDHPDLQLQPNHAPASPSSGPSTG